MGEGGGERRREKDAKVVERRTMVVNKSQQKEKFFQPSNSWFDLHWNWMRFQPVHMHASCP
jgi:hypothetical protein